MSEETKTPPVATATASTGANKPAPVVRIIVADNLRNPPMPKEAGGDTTFKLLYVADGVQHEIPCTAMIHAQISKFNLDMNKHARFHLTVSDGTVNHLSVEEKAGGMSLAASDSTDKPTLHPGALVLSRGPDRTVRAERLPERLPSEMLDEIIRLAMASERLSPGVVLGGKFTVLAVHAEVGRDLIYVDAMPR